MKDNIEVNLSENQKELVIRHGEAIPHYDKEVIEIVGIIDSPRKFWEKRKAEHEKLKCHVIFTKEGQPSIQLIMDEDSHFNGSVVGRLMVNPLIKTFGINTNKEYSIEEMKKFLRMNRAYFKDREANMALVSNLEKFHAQVKMDIEQNNDNRGNYTNKLQQTVEADFPLGFALKLAPYKGHKEEVFKCEICFSVTNGVTSIWFESPDLQEILLTKAAGIIDEELKAFKELVCIEQ